MKHQPLPILQAFLAAILFGASAPLAKLLLGEVSPVPLAALLYLGSGIGLAVLGLVLTPFQNKENQEPRLERSDLPWLFGAVLAGGVLAPILLLVSLERTPAATAALLLNFELVATTMIAALIFKEAIGKPVGWAIGLVTAAGIVLSWQAGEGFGFSAGALGVVGACFLWGLDNNLTRKISAKNPMTIVILKGLGAGTTSMLLAWLIGQPFPRLSILAAALLVGFFSYGFSIVLFIRAMRALGVVRSSAVFGAAPFVGAVIALILFWELPGVTFFLALPLMLVGAFLLLREHHEHEHDHPELDHEHTHDHKDIHHAHAHDHEQQDENGAHSHRHVHKPLFHHHAHAPDIHHWHEHTAS